MKQIGQILRSKRESLGMTLIDLEKKIKIQKKYIEMIEKNNFEHLPNPDYTRGFIEKYARCVNLNGKELIKQHESELPVKKISAREAIDALKATHTTENDDSTRKLFYFIIAGLGVLFIIWMLSQLLFTNKDEMFKPASLNPSRNISVEKKQEPVSKVDKPAIKKQVKPETSLTYKNFDGSNLTYEVKSQQPLTVKIVSKMPTWVQVFDDKNKNYVYNEIKEQSFKIDKEAKEVTIISGNSTSADIYINNQKVSVPKEAENLITRTYFFKVSKN
ncbi:helix-turn-helix domain-containing protein [Macrococcoides caseolyticum]|uniref:helix-turn-helix domain-containing protein n=1 Tax=Macrococcoides caseolyticum TaxID=69966 RepID=UPI000C154457|nr:helix-turn-helix domain-containing protein [Macrococcus caseolyticus]MBQ5153534.1 helix-turn-helix domain-containing protein [Macrococcus caseolyticus]RAI81680.1 helix-turn-helix domain-containing protein [Macrococcus caseolyticus subsp. hominis]RKO13428.1 helix-turn-helix domain-containing protein [Macrococcus caseolyticus]